MNWNARKLAVRQFCEAKIPSWYKIHSLDRFYSDHRIASLRLLALNTSVGFDCVEIERIHEDVPESISENFERHFWYSQYSLNDLYLIRLSVDHAPIYIFLIQGLVDDGWDNSGCWLEIFDEQGAFSSSARFDDESIQWREERIRGDNFYTPAPPWIGDAPNALVGKPMWSEDILAKYAVSIEQDGAKIRYVMSVE